MLMRERDFITPENTIYMSMYSKYYHSTRVHLCKQMTLSRMLAFRCYNLLGW